MRAALTGASGFIGSALLNRLGSGVERSALFRSPTASSEQWAQGGCRIVHGDLDDEDALAELVRGADTVFHCAARMAKSDLALSQRVNVDGTERLVRAAIAANVRRFVYVSSISVYSSSRRPDGTFTEEIDPDNRHRLNTYSYTKLLGEECLRPAVAGSGLTYTIIRPTNVYGPGSRSWFWQFEKLLHRVPVAFGNLPMNVVFIEDLVTGMIQAAEAQAAANEIFHIGHHTITMADFIARIGEVTDQRSHRLPRSLDYLVRWSIDNGFFAMTGKVPSMSLVRPARYPHDKAQRVFGYAPRYSLDEGFAETERWYKALSKHDNGTRAASKVVRGDER